jgi:hypothetical protein
VLTLCFGVARHLKCNAGDALGRAAALPVQGLTPARTFRREILVGSSNPRPELTVQNDFLQGEAMTSFPLSAIPATSRPVAGVTIPDSKLARELTDLVKGTESPLLFHHSSRVYYWGALTGKRHGLGFDPELLYAGAMFHDMGLTPQYASADKRFEVDGANVARDFLRSHGIAERDIETVWTA